ncbi:MAG: helix-turn-helix domain-containing protein [Actinomycetales bacterium]|nr:helix-turn-helix domain-containing protein [Actinomycetales bacterium]
MTTTTLTDDRLLSVEDLASMLGVPRQTIYVWRGKGYGPTAVKIGKYVRYRRSDVNVWIGEQVIAAA